MNLSRVDTITREAASLPLFVEPPGSPPTGGSVFPPCQRCIHGQVLNIWGINQCLQCGAEHTRFGFLLKPNMAWIKEIEKKELIYGISRKH